MRDLKGQTDGGERWKTFYAEETECMKLNIKKKWISANNTFYWNEVCGRWGW